MPRRALLFVMAGLLFATAGAATWTAGWADRPTRSPAAQPKAPPAWLSGDRIALTPDQLYEAYATKSVHREVKSILKIEKPLPYGEFVWRTAKVPDGDVWVRVDLDSQLISVFRAGHEIGTAVILYGAETNETPTGVLRVRDKRRDHRSATYGDAPMPYSLWLTNDGVAIHGSEVRWGAATHGCIGVPVEFARRLFDVVGTGDEVLVVPARIGPQARPSAAA